MIYDLFMKLSVKNDFSRTIPQGFRRLNLYGALLSILELETVAPHFHWMENGVKKWLNLCFGVPWEKKLKEVWKDMRLNK